MLSFTGDEGNTNVNKLEKSISMTCLTRSAPKIAAHFNSKGMVAKNDRDWTPRRITLHMQRLKLWRCSASSLHFVYNYFQTLSSNTLTLLCFSLGLNFGPGPRPAHGSRHRVMGSICYIDNTNCALDPHYLWVGLSRLSEHQWGQEPAPMHVDAAASYI